MNSFSLIIATIFCVAICNASINTCWPIQPLTNGTNCWPVEYTCDASGTEPNPAISWTTLNLPATANSYAVLMDDPTGGGYWVHWVWTDIPLTTTSATRGGSTAGTLTGNQLRSYQGPCGGPSNTYRITVYAMPTATITYTIGNKRGNTIDGDFRAMAVDVSTPVYITNFRGSSTVLCPDNAKACQYDESNNACASAAALGLISSALLFV